MDTSQYEQLTYDTVIERYPLEQFKQAINIGTPKIRPFTQKDMEKFPELCDYEGRRIIPKLGRYLCVGYEGEFFTTSEWSVNNQRVLVNADKAPDADGFRKYRIRDPQPVRYIILNFPFVLHRGPDDEWISQPEGG